MRAGQRDSVLAFYSNARIPAIQFDDLHTVWHFRDFETLGGEWKSEWRCTLLQSSVHSRSAAESKCSF